MPEQVVIGGYCLQEERPPASGGDLDGVRVPVPAEPVERPAKLRRARQRSLRYPIRAARVRNDMTFCVNQPYRRFQLVCQVFDDFADTLAVQDEVNEILLKPQGARQQLPLFAEHSQQASLLPHLSVLIFLSSGHVQRGRGLRPESLDQHQVLWQGAGGPARQEESHAVGADSQRDCEQRLYASLPESARQLGLLQPRGTVDI